MQGNNAGIDLRWFFTIIRRWWGFIAGFVLVAGMITVVATFFTPPNFSATATLLIDPARDPSINDYSALIAGQQLAVTYSQMIKSAPVLQAAITKIGLKAAPGDLAKQIDVEAVANTQLIRLTATDVSPTRAAQIANSVSETFVAQIQELNSERFASSLASLKDRMDSLSAQIDDTQAKVDTLNTKKNLGEAEIARLQNLLAGDRSDYQSLHQSYQSLQLIMTQVKGKVDVFEQATLASPSSKTATTTFWVDQAPNGTAGYPTLLQMLDDSPVLDATIAKLGLTLTADSLAKRTTIQWVQNTQLIQLSVAGDSSSQAVLLANTIAQIFVSQANTMLLQPYNEQLSSLQNQLDTLSGQIESSQAQIQTLTTDNSQTDTQLTNLNTLLAETHNDYRLAQQEYQQFQQTLVGSTDSVVISEPAQAPELNPLSRYAKNILLAVLVAAVLALGIAFLIEYMNDTLKTPKEINQALGLSTLGTIYRIPKGEDRLVMGRHPDSEIADSFRMLSTNIRFAGGKTPFKTLLVTSPVSSEGKSVVASNLAAAFALSGLTVIAMDADLRIPRLHQMFKLKEEVGLTGALMTGLCDDIFLKPAKVGGLKVLTSGGKASNPAELIGSPEMAELLAQLKDRADLIVIDSPPVLSLADTAILASQVDGVLLVIRSGQTYRRVAVDAVEGLRKIGANLIGVVINDVSEEQDGYYRYYRYSSDHKTSNNGSGGPKSEIASILKRNGGPAR